jgi:hypothetical protein
MDFPFELEDDAGDQRALCIGDEASRPVSTLGRGIDEFHHGCNDLDLTALGRQKEWKEPAGRARPFGIAGR